MTSFTCTIVSVVDADTFDVIVDRANGPYASDIRGNERIRMVNREVNALRPGFYNNSFQQQDTLIGRKVHCEIHSRSADQQLVVTARPL